MKKWKLISSKMAFDNRWFKVRQDKVELPNGKVLDDYFVWLKGNVSMIVPITEDKKMVFVKQYKHAAGGFMIEFPAGFVNDNEDPKKAAERELKEETGYTGNFSLIAELEDEPTKAVGGIFVYLARNLVVDSGMSCDDNEDIEVLKIPFMEVLSKIESGEINSNETIAAYFLAMKKLNMLKIIDN